MCGIAGYIGKSNNNEISFELISKIFELNESRGVDASGFWGFQSEANKVYTHKEPTRSSFFVKQSLWQNVSDISFDVIVTHARGASKGYGDPSDNRNNHPFLSDSNSIALIHNGKIEEHEYLSLKTKYKLDTDCDSEILLRLFECEINDNLNYQQSRIKSLHNIFSSINHGHMAVAIGEVYQNTSNLWLFRNKHRPLWLCDLRNSLGQIFFFSDPDLWINVIESTSKDCKLFLGKQLLTQINPDQIYHFYLLKDNSLMFDKFDVIRTSYFEPWIYNGNLVKKIYDNRLVVEKTIKEESSDEDDSLSLINELDNLCNSLCSTSLKIISLVKEKNSQKLLSNYEISEVLIALKNQQNILEMLKNILSM